MFPEWHDTRVDSDELLDTSWQVLEADGLEVAGEIGFVPDRLAYMPRATNFLGKTGAHPVLQSRPLQRM